MASPTEHSVWSDDSTREPWRCDSCGALIYNLDSRSNPAPGAPSSYFGGDYGGKRYEQVCTLCYQMKDVLTEAEFCKDKNYWRSIQTREDIIKKARMDKLKEGRGGLA